MVNPRNKTATAAVSLLALGSFAFGSLAFAGAGDAGASAQTSARTSATAPHQSGRHPALCANHKAILSRMRHSMEAYSDKTSAYASHFVSARNSGNDKSADRLMAVVVTRKAHQVQHQANFVARAARYKAADQSAGGC